MNHTRLIPLVALVVCWASSVLADAPLVFCTGYACGGDASTAYAYEVDSVSYPMMEFRVGTNDLNPEHYTNVLVPPGWHFAVEDVPTMHAHGTHTPHGEVSPGPCWCLTAGSVHWWAEDSALPVEMFTFGFDHPSSSEDVHWELATRREGPPPQDYTFYPFWDSPVGWGTGPLHGPLSATEYCWSNDDCAETDYCFFHVCAAETGVCLPRPEGCPDVWEPVCGCDGVTYGNACEAAMAGMSVDYEGACEGELCWQNQDCGEPGYCFLEECEDETGVCMLRPDICPPLWEPVCGCDGLTYANWCTAAVAGVSIDHWGACEGTLCWDNMDCGESAYCFFEQCAMETGVCMLRPEACPEVWDPVCGCDGVTYGNACEAAMAGMSVDYEGECEEQYCWSNDDCAETDYCFFHVCAAETGVCLPRPEGCPDVWEPVCGCDGVTYGNACEAAMAGMSVDYEGACEGESCWTSNDCVYTEDLYCMKEPGDCTDFGVCTQRPWPCPEYYDPVCGCDGTTYENECWAAAAGVSIAYYGSCEYCYLHEHCAPDQYCFFADCDLETGSCMPQPESCPYYYDPVCGCDGETYANACLAAVSGVSIAYDAYCLSGDLDLDGDVDLNDYRAFFACMQGPDQGMPLPCSAADFDGDIDVDLEDFQLFEVCFGAVAARIGQ